MRGGDGDAAVEVERPDREVDHLGTGEADVEDVCAAVARALDRRGGHRGRGNPHVAADGDAPRLELLRIGPSDRICAVLVDLAAVEAAHVVRLEHPGIEHGGESYGKGAARGTFEPSTVVSTLRYMERKLATVLFADLVGSTALVSSADPEVVRRRVNRYFAEVSHAVEAHGGVVEKFAGDAVLAAFGVPQAHEDDAERAIKAAFAIHDQVRELGLEARIGIESGEVVVDDGAESTFVTGEAVNVAARLQQQAGSGRGPDRPGRTRPLLPGRRRRGDRARRSSRACATRFRCGGRRAPPKGRAARPRASARR